MGGTEIARRKGRAIARRSTERGYGRHLEKENGALKDKLKAQHVAAYAMSGTGTARSSLRVRYAKSGTGIARSSLFVCFAKSGTDVACAGARMTH
eukprot:1738685-Rhodomonas_salina.3